jgi:hypothetical protein
MFDVVFFVVSGEEGNFWGSGEPEVRKIYHDQNYSTGLSGSHPDEGSFPVCVSLFGTSLDNESTTCEIEPPHERLFR